MIKRLAFELDEQLHYKIKQKALERKTSMREAIIKLLKEWVEKEE